MSTTAAPLGVDQRLEAAATMGPSRLPARPTVVVVAEAFPMRGGIATFAETLVADPGLQGRFDVQLLNLGRLATRTGGRFSMANVRYALADAWRTFRAARHADVMHLQLVADPGLPTLRAAALCAAARLGRARLIAHVHAAVGNAGRPETAGYSPRDRAVLAALSLADEVLTVSDAGTETFRRIVWRTPVATVDNAVDVASFEAAPLTAAVPTVVFVGIVCRRKGVAELAEAAARLRDRGVAGWRLLVVGGQGPTPPDEYQALLDALAAAGFADAAVGARQGPEVRELLRASDVFVLPSYLEGQPMAILEAMATGLPVVAGRVGAIPAMIRDGVEGRVVEPGDVAGLADALEELVTSGERRRAMGAAARRRAEERHDLTRLSASVAAAYDRVLAGRPPRRVRRPQAADAATAAAHR